MEGTDFFFFFLALPLAFLSTLQKRAWFGNSYLSSPKAFRRSWFKISCFLEICSTWENETCPGSGHVFFLPGYWSPVAEWVPVVVMWKWIHHSMALMPACSLKSFGRKRCVWYLGTDLSKHIGAENARKEMDLQFRRRHLRSATPKHMFSCSLVKHTMAIVLHIPAICVCLSVQLMTLSLLCLCHCCWYCFTMTSPFIGTVADGVPYVQMHIRV